MTAGLQLGRPGVYQVPIREPEVLGEVRLDVTGFAGVALRGPVNVATPVNSWADFQNRFGGLERNVSGRDRLLPFAVQAFFAQGGRRAVIVRVAPADGPDRRGVPTSAEATATFRLGPDPSAGLVLEAADEGAWGSSLQISLEFSVTVTVTAVLSALDQLTLATSGTIPDASLVRIRYPQAPLGVLRWARLRSEPAFRGRRMSLDEPLPAGIDQDRAPTTVTVGVVTGALTVTDPGGGRREHISGLGLHPRHSRYPDRVLTQESLLVRMSTGEPPALRPDLLLTSWSSTRVHSGQDRSDAVDRDSFFDPGAADDDPLDELPSHRGVDLLGRVREIGLLSVPDLGWRRQDVPAPRPPAERDQPLVWRPACGCPPELPEPPLDQPAPRVPSLLDGTDPVEFDALVERQRRAVQVADLRRRFVVLLDVPSGLSTAQITDWRATFDSSYAAAYHPWLGVPRPSEPGGIAVLVPPSAFAAGITADRERRLGLSRGPANQLALGAVRLADPITDPLADQLHGQSINVFLAERDGFRLGAARTLSSDRDYRQLSVRRLMTMLSLTLQRYGEVLVFEPNTGALRGRLTNAVTELLRTLHRRGAFSGATEAQSFFVRCDDATNPARSQEQGRLVAEIGVAPAAPLEYLVLRVASDGNGGLLVDEQPRAGLAGNVAAEEVPRV